MRCLKISCTGYTGFLHSIEILNLPYRYEMGEYPVIA